MNNSKKPGGRKRGEFVVLDTHGAHLSNGNSITYVYTAVCSTYSEKFKKSSGKMEPDGCFCVSHGSESRSPCFCFSCFLFVLPTK